MAASPSPSLLTTHKLMCLGKGFCKIPAAPEGENKSHDESATSHRAGVLSDGNVQLEPDQSPASYASTSEPLQLKASAPSRLNHNK